MKTWLITGCSSGFGQRLALAAAQRGDRVIATARNVKTIGEMAEAFGGRMITMPLDVTDAAAAKTAVAKAVDYISKYPAYQIADSSPLPGGRRRLVSHVLRSIPPRLAAFVLPRDLHDRHYVRRLFPSMIALQKTAPDERSWNWFVPF